LQRQEDSLISGKRKAGRLLIISQKKQALPVHGGGGRIRIVGS